MVRPPAMRAFSVDAADGVKLRVHVGDAPAGGTRALLVGPPSATVQAFAYQVDYLGAHVGFVGWDWRGLHGSTRPARDAWGMEAQLADAQVALDAAAVKGRFAIVAWGVGCEVALSLAARLDGRVSQVVLLDGVYGARFATALGVGDHGAIAPAARRVAHRAYPFVARVRGRIGAWPETSAWLKRLGLAAATLDDELFAELAGAFKKVDVDAYALTMRALLDEPHAPLPSSLAMPVLVVEGSRDRWGSVVVARRLVRKLPLGELFVVKGGTHYTPLEFPELVNLRIEKFLAAGA